MINDLSLLPIPNRIRQHSSIPQRCFRMKTPFLSSLMRLTANWKVVTKITAGFGSVITVFILVLALSF